MAFLTNNIVSVLSVTILTGATVSSSLLGVAKATGSFTASKLEVPVQNSSDTSSSSASPSAAPSPTPHKINKVILPTAAFVLTQNSTSSQQTNSNSCIITLFGSQYDVTTLKDTHSGGNVFVCGTDQTALYESQHGNNLDRMKPYLVASGTGGSISAPAQGSSIGSRNNKKDKENHGRNQDEEEEMEANRE